MLSKQSMERKAAEPRHPTQQSLFRGNGLKYNSRNSSTHKLLKSPSNFASSNRDDFNTLTNDVCLLPSSMFLVGSSKFAGDVKLARDKMLSLLNLGSAAATCCVFLVLAQRAAPQEEEDPCLNWFCDRLKHATLQILRHFAPSLAQGARGTTRNS